MMKLMLNEIKMTALFKKDSSEEVRNLSITCEQIFLLIASLAAVTAIFSSGRVAGFMCTIFLQVTPQEQIAMI